MPRAWIALGSNVGEREAHLAFALAELERTPGVRVLRRSRWIETAPVGGPSGQGRFLNGVAELDCRPSSVELLERLLSIENAAGRVRGVRDGPRTLDLDLLLYGDERHDGPQLVLPHPRMELRTFVLEPLCELAPSLVLPGCGESVSERLARLREHG